MNAVAERRETQVAEVQDMAGGLLAVIERAARDPNVDIDKMERLLAMQERVQERNAKAEFIAAKVAMRPELPEVTMKGNIVIHDKSDKTKVIQSTPFARFEDIHEAVTPVLTAHGFDLSFRNGLSPDGKVRVTTVLSHIAGHSEETFFDLPHDSSGSKNSVQAVGSSTSYGKRYGTLSILNIKVAGEDDDGAEASYKDPSGEPMARTKLEGPHSSKSALKAAVQKIRNEVNACFDVAQLNAILKAGKETIEQAERDWTALLDGNPDIAEDHGLKGDVAARREYLKQDGGMFAAMLKSMQECETLASLNHWRTANEAVVEELDGAAVRAFERAWDAHEAKLQEKENGK